MNLETARIIIDFGLVVLIWIIQLVVYPSFKFYTPLNLYNWHKRYTKGVTVIVLPLMVSQLMISIISVIKIKDIYNIIYLALVLLTWIITMLIFVPLHNKISNKKTTDSTIINLVKLNWIRVIIWTTVFLISIINLK